MVELGVPVAFVALAREDVLDHAIWTVVVVPHPVVTGHHRHSLELVLVEAPVIEIVDVIAHTTHFRLFLSLSPQAGGGAGIHPGGSPGGSGGPGNGDGPRGTSGSSEKANPGGD